MGSMTPSRYGGSTSATPNRGPNTPGTPWARPMDEFEVMESPAVREAMAGRPALQMSPAASLPSPGLVSSANLPNIPSLQPCFTLVLDLRCAALSMSVIYMLSLLRMLHSLCEMLAYFQEQLLQNKVELSKRHKSRTIALQSKQVLGLQGQERRVITVGTVLTAAG